MPLVCTKLLAAAISRFAVDAGGGGGVDGVGRALGPAGVGERLDLRGVATGRRTATWASVAPAALNAATARAVRAAHRLNGGATTDGALLAASVSGTGSAGATATS